MITFKIGMGTVFVALRCACCGTGNGLTVLPNGIEICNACLAARKVN